MGEGKLGFWSVFSIGVGGMIGGGIFAVLGLAVQLAKGGTPIAFALAGIIAFVTSYSYAKLSLTYPCQGGTVESLNQAFGTGIFTGSLNILLWLSYIVILSLYSYAFGSYAASFFGSSVFFKHVFITGIIILITILNLLSSKVVGEAEEGIVAFKVAILFLFVITGLWSVKVNRFMPSEWAYPIQLILGGMIIFLAYEGFELIANTAADVDNPKRLPLAYYTAVGFVIFTYIMVAIITVGNLPYDQIVQAKDYALAAAAKPFLGSMGFVLIAIAALLSTTSAINATLYGSARVSYIIAKDGELPEILERKVWNKPIEGLLITSVMTLLMANFLNLSSISTMGSAGFLLIFASVNLANMKLYSKTRSNRVIPLIGALMCVVALSVLVVQTTMLDPGNLLILVIMVGVSFVIEFVYRIFSKRKIQTSFRN
ncbi:amino acid transporter [Archaeoglobales archaeon]|nr:MAG: amino acid transporter [Archaeoglobales archaeon]